MPDKATDVQSQFPKYKCFKEVSALFIEDIKVSNDKKSAVVSFGKGYDGVKVGADFLKRVGKGLGYMVIYKDGYMSWSPKDVFEEGYALIR
ncbi:hypothetical protein ACFL4H_00125 [Candidatus Neomarinimicrobiota bacterium]